MRIFRRILGPAVALLFAATFVVSISAGPVVATPVATNEELYQLYGRVFPDPHGCLDGAPATSPWAKGHVCAGQFVQWEEALSGLQFLEDRFPRYLQVLNLRPGAGVTHSRELQLDGGLPGRAPSGQRRDPDRRVGPSRSHRAELPPVRAGLVQPDLHGVPGRREPPRLPEARPVRRTR